MSCPSILYPSQVLIKRLLCPLLTIISKLGRVESYSSHYLPFLNLSSNSKSVALLHLLLSSIPLFHDYCPNKPMFHDYYTINSRTVCLFLSMQWPRSARLVLCRLKNTESVQHLQIFIPFNGKLKYCFILFSHFFMWREFLSERNIISKEPNC